MKTSSRFYSSLGLLVLLNVLIKPIWIFGIDRQVQNELGTEAYGAYFSLFNFSILFSFLLDWGISSYYNRQLAAEKEEFAGKAGRFLLIKLFFAVLYSLLVLLVAFLNGLHEWSILVPVIAIQVFSSLFLFGRAILTARQWFFTDAWLSVLDKTLMILLCGTFLYFPAIAGHISVERFLFAQLGCTVIAFFIVLILLLRKKIRFSFGPLPKKLWRSALPYACIVLLMSVHYRLDGFLLQQLQNDYQAGLYAGAYRLLDAGNMAGYLVASFLLPFIARHQQAKDIVTRAVLDCRHLLIIFSIALTIIFLFLAPWIQRLLYHNDDAGSIELLRWCIPALIGYSLVQVYGTVLTARGHISIFCYITLIAVLLNVILNLWLIPIWGAKGSCIAALASHGLCGIATFFYAWEKCGQSFHVRSFLFYIFIGATLFAVLYLFRRSALPPVLQLLAAGFFLVAAVIATRLIKWRRWKTILNK